MKAITFKKTALLVTAILFAAACNTRNDSTRTGTNNDNTTPAQSGNAEAGARTDTMTGNGTMYQGGSPNTNTNNSSQSAQGSYQNNPSQNQQGQTGTTTNRQTGGGVQNDQRNTSANISSTERNFIMEAYKGGQMEVKMANMAMERAQSVRVKDFANMMVRDHTKANNELETILSRQNMMTEVEKENKDDNNMQDMNNKTGRDFDVAYMRMMVNDHNKTIDLFKNESNSGNDSDLKDFASKTLPTLRIHLDSAKAIYSSLGNATTTRNRR
jgi:putative membrane protein